jgi:hypothetical protein
MKILLTQQAISENDFTYFNRARSRYRVLRKRYKSFFVPIPFKDKVTVVEVDFLKDVGRDP